MLPHPDLLSLTHPYNSQKVAKIFLNLPELTSPYNTPLLALTCLCGEAARDARIPLRWRSTRQCCITQAPTWWNSCSCRARQLGSVLHPRSRGCCWIQRYCRCDLLRGVCHTVIQFWFSIDGEQSRTAQKWLRNCCPFSSKMDLWWTLHPWSDSHNTTRPMSRRIDWMRSGFQWNYNVIVGKLNPIGSHRATLR